jgi:DNA-binding CsgD family transcriptional regulator/tetratricopeptide (TPR) repeat protein
VELQGRETEQKEIGTLLEGARAGVGGALVLLGEPGSGKSSLLSDTAHRAAGMRVLRTTGIESEAPLAFAALQRLLRPVLPLLDRLPAPQATALRVAFGQEAGEAGDRFLVFLGALSLLAEAAAEQPVLVLVDDAQWLDDASAAALLFVARRVQVEALVLLFAARENDPRSFDGGDLPRHRLRPLDLAAVSAILAASTQGAVSPEVGAQLLASTGGNPLALVELPEMLTVGQLQGREPLPDRLPVTERIERVFLDRARRLSPAAQQLLLVAAVDDSTRVGTVLQAGARLGIDAEALTEVERSGLVSVSEDQLVLRHPLVRSALYTAAPTEERRQVHTALAEVLTREEDADRRAWHRSAAVVEPDESVVDDLVDAARRAESRGGHEAAAAAGERAAELTADQGRRAERLYQAARAAWVAGHPLQAKTLADTARHGAQDPLLRADSGRLLARVEWNTGSVSLAHQLLLETARDVAPYDEARAREIATEATSIAAFGGESGVRIDPAAFIGAPGPDAPARDRCYAEFLRGLIQVLAGEWSEAAPPLRRAFEIHAELEGDYELLPNLAVAAVHIGDYHVAEVFLRTLLTQARNAGAAVMVLYALTRLPMHDYTHGTWSSGAARASEAVRLGDETGQRVLAAGPRGWLLLLAALRQDDAVDQLAGELEVLLAGAPVGVLDGLLKDLAHWTGGVKAFGQPAAAFHHLAQISHDWTRRLAGLERIEAAVRADQRQAALSWVEDLTMFAEATGHAWAAAIAEHGRALLADDDAAEGHFTRALELHDAAGRPFDRARTELAYGEFLRRSRRRVDARTHLRAALQTFLDLPAPQWAERATQELRASGETVRKRDDAVPVTLTPQELQVAELVKQGLSNREVAGQHFGSPRTGDFHLRTAFTKTGVTSRMELVNLALS